MYKLLIIGHTNSGKSTAANIIAEMVDGKVANESDYIIAEYAKENGLDVSEVVSHKSEYRERLYQYAREKQAKDPTYPVDLAFKDGANIITGTRNRDELVAKRKFYDLIIWVERPGVGPGPTDKLLFIDADICVVNGGTIDELKNRLRWIFRSWIRVEENLPPD